MRQETVQLFPNRSVNTTLGKLFLSTPAVGTIDFQLVVGRIGFPSVNQQMRVGGALLYETPDDGLIEVRVTQIAPESVASRISAATLLVTQLSPRGGITGGFSNEDATNAPFEPQELRRLKASLQKVRDAAAEREDLTPQQIDYVSRKLNEMAEAAERLGRKDWINLAVGTLTNVVVSAALNPEVAKFIFQAVGNALSWLVGSPLKLLP